MELWLGGSKNRLAERGTIDDVIMPHTTRKRLARALAIPRNKDIEMPVKYSNIAAHKNSQLAGSEIIKDPMPKSFFPLLAAVAAPLRSTFDHWTAPDHLPWALHAFKCEKARLRSSFRLRAWGLRRINRPASRALAN